MKRVLVAGCTGVLGSSVARLGTERGWHVRGFARDRERLAQLGDALAEFRQGDALVPTTLAHACDDIDVVFSCIGASPRLSFKQGRQGFFAVDVPANENLIAEAKRAGVRRFVYVSIMHTPETRPCTYVAAHEAVVDRLRESGLKWCVVRPTAFFSLLSGLVDLALRGAIPEFGDGMARTNPIDEDDLAAVCVQAIEDGPQELAAGGPDILTRRRIAEMAFEAVGKPPKLLHVPPWMGRVAASGLYPLSPRIAQFLRFGVEVMQRDLIAPVHGRHRLADFFRAYAAQLLPTRPIAAF